MSDTVKSTSPVNLSFDITPRAWEDISLDEALPRSRLLTSVQINGIDHHVEAIEVEYEGDDHLQKAACSRCEDILSRYAEAAGSGERFSTVSIAGKNYALFLSPYCY